MNEPRATKWSAPKGAIWVCGACGKTSHNRVDGDEKHRSWDESCMLNAVLCKEDTVVRGSGGAGRVTNADPWPRPWPGDEP